MAKQSNVLVEMTPFQFNYTRQVVENALYEELAQTHRGVEDEKRIDCIVNALSALHIKGV
jgi:hypothetical protein